MFVNTFRGQGDTIITVKTPNTLYIFYYPHSKIPSPKRQQNDGCLFFALIKKKTAKYLLSIILLQSRNSTVEMPQLHYKKTSLDLHR